jgi:hypothetical protein
MMQICSRLRARLFQDRELGAKCSEIASESDEARGFHEPSLGKEPSKQTIRPSVAQ